MNEATRSRPRVRAALAALGVLALGLAGAAAYGSRLPGPMDDAPPAPTDPAARPPGGPLSADHPAFQPRALIDKPLFSAARARPTIPPPLVSMVVAAAPSPAPEEPAPAILVRGIVATPTFRKALLRTGEGLKPGWFAEGDICANGWVIASIGPSAVILSKVGRTMVFSLKPKRSAIPQLVGN